MQIFGNQNRVKRGRKRTSRKTKRPARSVLSVNARGGATRGPWLLYRLGAMLLVALVVAAAVVAAGVAGSALVGSAFKRNPEFANITIEAESDGLQLLEEQIIDYARLHDVENLFAVDIEKVREDFLDHVFVARDLVVTRRLPDTLILSVSERVPVARVKNRWAVDRDGVIFGTRADLGDLPVIRGYPSALLPGNGSPPAVLLALEIIRAQRPVEDYLQIREIDVSDAERHVVLHCREGAEVTFAWSGMGNSERRSDHALTQRLKNLAGAFVSAEKSGQWIHKATYVNEQLILPGEGRT